MSPVTGLRAQFVGSYRNERTRYYWVQAIYSGGRSTIAGPASVTCPTFFDSNNFVQISWEPQPDAIDYDVIVTDTSASPTGTLTSGGLALGTSKTSARDVGYYVTWTLTNPAISNIASTDDVPEGATNLYYTAARVNAIIAALLASKQNVIAAGTTYTITGTSAAVDFGTTDPAIVLPAAGTYLLLVRARIDNVGATYSANRTITLKLRRTNNTPADVAGSTMVLQTGIITTIDNTAGNLFAFAFYTTALTNDAIALFAGIDVVADAGASKVTDAVISAVRLT